MTGVLLIALNESVKAMPLLMGLEKGYIGVMEIHKDSEKINQIFKDFEGEIVQTPPVRSRVARKPRKRTIHSLEMLEKKGRIIRFEVKCESGVYIRKLVHDIGLELGTGAHLKELKRTNVGPFEEGECVKLEDLNVKNVLSLEYILERIGTKKIFVSSEKKVRNGMPLLKSDISKSDKNIKRYETVVVIYNKKIIALAKYSELTKIVRVLK